MKQTNPETVERYWPTLGLSCGPGGTIDHPVALAGMVPAGPVGTEPGCLHPECVLEHPHDGPAILSDEGAGGATPDRKPSGRRTRAAGTE